MSLFIRCMAAAALIAAPMASTLAQNLNPGNAGGGRMPIATPTYGPEVGSDPALTTGSRFSVTKSTPADENPTVPGATGLGFVRGDQSTISGDRRATVEQKTGGSASDAPG